VDDLRLRAAATFAEEDERFLRLAALLLQVFPQRLQILDLVVNHNVKFW